MGIQAGAPAAPDPGRRSGRPMRAARPSRSVRWLELASIGVIVALAASLRLADLATNPGGLYPDEAAEGLDALRLLHVPGYHPVFFHDDAGREALFGYLVAAAFRVFGESTLVLRATAAAVGTAAVAGIWLLARRFGRIAGVAAAGWAAGSLWLIAVSRDGMRNTLVPLLGSVALAALLRWQERPTRSSAIVAGAATSLAALYTYQPLKLLPVLVVIWLAWLRRTDSASWARLRPQLAAAVASFTLVAVPMVVAAVGDPLTYFGRTVGVTSLNPEVQSDASLVGHVLRTLGMFAVTGDPNPRHDVAALPLLGWPVTIVALVGLVGAWRCRRDPAMVLLLWSLPVFLLPPLVAIEGASPHFLRSLGLAAPLGVMVGLGVDGLGRTLRARWGTGAGRAALVGCAAGLVGLAIAGGVAYLSRPVADRYDAFTFDLVEIAGLARDQPGAVVVLDDYSAIVVRFLDFDAPPMIVEPGSPITDPGNRPLIVARTRDELVAAAGESLAEGARPVAFDPAGLPRAWAISPSIPPSLTP